MASSADPFEVLSLPPSASAADVLAARRRLARSMHPDVGGDEGRMQEVNRAVDEALRLIARRDDDVEPTARFDRVAAEMASFTVEALPAVTHHALLEVAGALGSVITDDPPYLLEALVETREFGMCWCLLEVLPEAGSSSVNLYTALEHPGDSPRVLRGHDLVEAIRDVWIAALNGLDWGDS